MSAATNEASVKVRHEPGRSRYEILVDGELAGFADYLDEGDGLSAFPHTEVFAQFGGRGLGTRLVADALADVADRGGSVRPYCSFVRGYLQNHPELAHLVPEPDRPRFGL